jgi:hypothetical protein
LSHHHQASDQFPIGPKTGYYVKQPNQKDNKAAHLMQGHHPVNHPGRQDDGKSGIMTAWVDTRVGHRAGHIHPQFTQAKHSPPVKSLSFRNMDDILGFPPSSWRTAIWWSRVVARSELLSHQSSASTFNASFVQVGKHQEFHSSRIRIVFLSSQHAPHFCTSADDRHDTSPAPLVAARKASQLNCGFKAHTTCPVAHSPISHFQRTEQQRFAETVLCLRVAIGSSLKGNQWQLLRHTFTSCQTIMSTSTTTSIMEFQCSLPPVAIQCCHQSPLHMRASLEKCQARRGGDLRHDR